uniref:Cathepsin L n=1 Tax=Lygus hesperus TaxID=30085 RepID=A0A146LBS1_LYGHE
MMNSSFKMTGGLVLLLLVRLSLGSAPLSVNNEITANDNSVDVSNYVDDPTEEVANEVNYSAEIPSEDRGRHDDFFEVKAKCGKMFGSKKTTLGSVSWSAKYEEISKEIQLFAEKCKTLGEGVPNQENEWENYKAEHGKSYSSSKEDKMRRKLYFRRKADIDAHNARYKQGLTSYSMKLNHFSDMHPEEMEQTLGKLTEVFLNDTDNFITSYYTPSNLSIPAFVDWRKKGLVTSVKNQGNCGSCWAFSTVGGIEGQWKKHKGRLVSLSPQQLVDCSYSSPNKGCNGGNVGVALKDIMKQGGIESEQAYPYRSGNGQRYRCRFDRRKVAATVRGWVNVPSGNEGALADCVANKGPTSAMIVVTQPFFHYHQGVFDDPPCRSKSYHAILVVGYGRQRGRDYWLIKNSWGTGWGQGGFGLMSRNRNNQCIIASYANVPQV